MRGRNAFTMIISLICVFAAGANAQNLVSNPGFEEPFIVTGTPHCDSAVAPGVGNWTAATVRMFGGARQVSFPFTFRGFQSAEVTSGFRPCDNAYLLQSVPLRSHEEFDFSAWFNHQSGSQQIAMLFGYDPDTRTSVESFTIAITPGAVTFSDSRGFTHTQSFLPSLEWMRVGIASVSGASVFSINFFPVAARDRRVPFDLPTTIFIGEPERATGETDSVYYDEISLFRVNDATALQACHADLQETQSSLNVCTSDLSDAVSDTQTCNNDLTTARNDLTAALARIATLEAAAANREALIQSLVNFMMTGTADANVADVARAAADTAILAAIERAGPNDSDVIRAQREYAEGVAALGRNEFNRAIARFTIAFLIAQKAR